MLSWVRACSWGETPIPLSSALQQHCHHLAEVDIWWRWRSRATKWLRSSWFPEKSAWFWDSWCYTSNMFCDMQLTIEFLSQKTCSKSSWEYPYFTEAAVLLKHLKWNRKDKNAKLLLILIENHNYYLAWYHKTKWVFPFNWK